MTEDEMSKQKNAPTAKHGTDPVQREYPADGFPKSGHGSTKNAGLSAGELPKDLPRSGVAK